MFHNVKLILHNNLLRNKQLSVLNSLNSYFVNLRALGENISCQSEVKYLLNCGNFYYFSFKIYNINLIINLSVVHCAIFGVNNGSFNLKILPYSGLYFTNTNWKTFGLLSFMPFTLYSLVYIKFVDKFMLLIDIVGLDILNKLPNVYRLVIVYLFQSLVSTVGYELIILNENSTFLSLSLDYINGFSGSIWAEREIFDLFGVVFYGNWDCGRILNDYGFGGFPLRKDFPLSGFFDCYYSLSHKGLLKQKLELMQIFGIFYK